MAEAVGELVARARLSDAREESGSRAKKIRPAELEALLAEARATPPEIAASTLISIADSPLIEERERKRELLEEAFHLAAKAQQPLKRRYIGGNVDTRTGYLGYAFDQRLDRLSLQASAIEKLLPIDPAKTRELVWQMPKLEVPAAKCEDSMLPEVGAFYEMLLKVAQHGFTPEQLANGEHVNLIAPHLADLSSPVQVAPALMLLSELRITPAQLAALVKSLADGLDKTSSDDRAFSRADYPPYQSLTHLLVLGSVCLRQGIMPLELYEKYRAYLVRNLSGSRCSDNVFSNDGKPRATPSAVTGFNNLFAAKLATLTPIRSEELQPAKLEGRMRLYEYWQTPRAKSMLKGVKVLRFGDWDQQSANAKAGKPVPPLTLEERQSLTWNRQLNEFLSELSQWRPEHEASEADYFHQKCVVFYTLLDLTPPGAIRERVLNEYLSFLKLNRFQRESLIEWYWKVRELTRYLDTPDQAQREWLLEALRNSGDQVIQLQAKLETVLRPLLPNKR